MAGQASDTDELNPWRGLPEFPPYTSPIDDGVLTTGAVAHAGLKLNCLPVPWIGDPRSAGIVLLGLNPGWVETTEELERGEYATQNRLGLTFQSRVPMWNLDARLAGTPGYGWWSRRLRLVIEAVGLDRVQTAVACVEWLPYHSPTFRRLPAVLPSQEYGFRLVSEAADRGAVIVLMRSRKLWLDAVPALSGADLLEMKVPRSPYLTPANLTEAGFARICDALTG
jgi:hypothetical protein